MLLQQSPFRGEDEDEIYDAILADEPLYPIHMPRDSVSILQKLLTREPELRLGSGPTDAQEIMSHAFFRNINWEDVYHKRIPAPFIPTISNATDTSNFDQEFTSVTPVLTPVQSGKWTEQSQKCGLVTDGDLQCFRRRCRRSSVGSHTLPTSFEWVRGDCPLHFSIGGVPLVIHLPRAVRSSCLAFVPLAGSLHFCLDSHTVSGAISRNNPRLKVRFCSSWRAGEAVELKVGGARAIVVN